MTITDETTHVNIIDANGLLNCLRKNGVWISEEPTGNVTICSTDGFVISFHYTEVTNITALDAQDLIETLCTYFFV